MIDLLLTTQPWWNLSSVQPSGKGGTLIFFLSTGQMAGERSPACIIYQHLATGWCQRCTLMVAEHCSTSDINTTLD